MIRRQLSSSSNIKTLKGGYRPHCSSSNDPAGELLLQAAEAELREVCAARTYVTEGESVRALALAVVVLARDLPCLFSLGAHPNRVRAGLKKGYSCVGKPG